MTSIPFPAFAAFLIAGILADLITTHVALRRGFHELNPIMEKTGHPVLVSAVVSAIVTGVVIWAAPYEPSIARWFCLLGGLYRWTFAVVNFVRLRKGRP